VGRRAWVVVRGSLVLLNRHTLRTHAAGIVVLLAGTAAAIVYYAWASAGQPQRPGGSSTPGLLFGLTGGAIILFEMLLFFRKKCRGVRRVPLGRVQWWLRWHIWLGLLSVPLIVLHTGFEFGGTLALATFVLFLLVIASGIVGLVLQQVIPRRLLEEVPEETIFAQIDRVCARFGSESEALVLATCGAGEEAAPRTSAPPRKARVVIGAERSMRNFRGKALPVDAPSDLVAGADVIRFTFEKSIRPYLLRGRRSRSVLRNRTKAAAVFADLKASVAPEAHPTIDALAGYCQKRRQLDVQERLQALLHGWLVVHLPLSVLMFAAMMIHAVYALRYSGILDLLPE
jgi:hypothetical protein